MYSLFSGKPIFGIVVAEIIRSEASDYPVGTYIMGMGNFEEYSIFSGPEELAARLFRPVPTGSGIPWTTWLGALGGQVRSGPFPSVPVFPFPIFYYSITYNRSYGVLELQGDRKAQEGRNHLRWVNSSRAPALLD